MLLLAAAACGSALQPPPPLPSDALPGDAGDPKALDASSVASDAIDLAELESLLQDAGFAGGTQRQFGQSDGITQRRALARVLAFGSPEGADSYLGWLRDHVDEVIGTAELLDPPALPGGSLLALSEPGDCCPKATDVYLIAWRKGSSVLSLEVGGEAVDEALVTDLAMTLDRAVGG